MKDESPGAGRDFCLLVCGGEQSGNKKKTLFKKTSLLDLLGLLSGGSQPHPPLLGAAFGHPDFLRGSQMVSHRGDTESVITGLCMRQKVTLLS